MNNDRGTNILDIRASNALLILNILRQKPTPRAELAKQTGLSRAGVSLIIDDLISKGIIEETTISKNGTGRKALELIIKADSAYVVGVHLRTNEYSIGLFNFSGKMLQIEKHCFDDSHDVVAQLIELGKTVLAVVEKEHVEDRVIGVGVCSSGPVDVDEGKIIRSSSKWNGIGIVRILESVVPWKCFLENRSNARAMFEKLYGVCKDYNNFIFLKVDEAVGGAIVYKGEVLNGFNKFGNEFGHMSIRYDGERCECGNVGCLDMYASIPAILKQFPQCGNSWQEIVDKAYDGDTASIQAIRQEAEYLSTGIINLCNIFEPEVIALAGDITYRHSLILALISESVNSRHILRNTFNSKILITEQVESIYLKSGAAIVIENFYEGNLDCF